MPPGISKAVSLGSELAAGSKPIAECIERQSISQFAQTLLAGGDLGSLPAARTTVKNSDFLIGLSDNVRLPEAKDLLRMLCTTENTFQHEYGHFGRMALETERNGGVATAYKTLTADGSSPFAPSVKWSLPRRGEDGKWIPGQWKDWEPTKLPITPGGNRPGLYVSNNGPWIVPFGGKSRYFEAEIGDAASLSRWKLEPSGDFAARRVRLTKELTEDEAFALLDKR